MLRWYASRIVNSIITSVIHITAISTLPYCITQPAYAQISSEENSYEQMSIIGESTNFGIADPSLEYDENGIGWMSYSAVDAKDGFSYVSTHLAKSIDHGKTWTYVSTINQSTKDTIRPMLPIMIKTYGKEIVGTWFHEVSTLVHDPDDKGKEWKLYWHHYFMKPNAAAGQKALPGGQQRVLQYGWIAYKYASTPDGKWSKEIPLFGAGIAPLKPYKAKIDLNKLHPSLRNCIAYSEPGSLTKEGVLYMTLQGHTLKEGKNITHIILIASHDHGKTWKYINTLLKNEDSYSFGGQFFSSTSLTQEAGRTFLFASPFNEQDLITAFHGTVIYEFDDIKTGKLKTDPQGNAIPYKHLKPSLTRGGQSDYDEQNTYGGIIMPQLNLVTPPLEFRIYSTKEKIIEK